jgi:hypothetical protein
MHAGRQLPTIPQPVETLPGTARQPLQPSTSAREGSHAADPVADGMAEPAEPHSNSPAHAIGGRAPPPEANTRAESVRKPEPARAGMFAATVVLEELRTAADGIAVSYAISPQTARRTK